MKRGYITFKRLIVFLKTHFKTFTLFHAFRKILITSVYKRLTDNVMADHVYAKSSFHYLEKFYKKHKAKFNFLRPSNDIDENDFIYWTCWLQGMESAPALVKACVNSAEKHASGHRIIIITYDNLPTYVSLPDFILDKHKKGHIPAAHFSDIVRVFLLYIYGGAWFDATVFFTRPIPESFLKEPLFFFKRPLHDAYCPAGNWFIIAAKPKNYLLHNLLCVLIEYWRIKNKYIDYFMFHYLLQAIILHDPESTEIFNKIPYHNDQNPHFILCKLLFSQYNKELWEIAKNVSFCHKLTYKIPPGSPMEKNREYYSFYSFICEL
jgi:hypothetical protein